MNLIRFIKKDLKRLFCQGAKWSSLSLYKVWPGDAVYPDFGHKAVRKWWAENCKFLVDLGVDGIWDDMNEPASFNGEIP